jgi:phytoene desaturase
MKIAVVGAGLGGLSAAIRLAVAGNEVEVFEQGGHPGGKAGTERIGEYRFDTGPSLYTMPWVFEDLFAVAGRSIEDYLDLVPLDPICRYFYPDGTRIDAPPGSEALSKRLEETTNVSEKEVLAFMEHSRRIYDITADVFLYRSLNEPSSFFRWSFLRSLLQIGRIDAFRTMHRAASSYFDDPRVQQLFDRYATYNGSNPYSTPGTLNIIPYVEYEGGAYAVRGGITAVPHALARLAGELGVEIHYDAPVERIVHSGERKQPIARWTEYGVNPSNVVPPQRNPNIVGVQVDGKELVFPVVVSDVDVSTTYRHLLADEQARDLRRYEEHEPSSSGLVFYWGIRRRVPELASHNIFFSRNYRQEFDDIWLRRVMPTDPTIYINITSKTTPSDAPSDGENWFVLLNAPYRSGQDWAKEVETSRAKVLARLTDELGFSVEDAIEVEKTMTPVDIEQNTGSFRGALYGISSNDRRAAFSRHPNRSRKYKGLYFCGGSTHPGGGMPLVVLSGKIAAEQVLRHEKRAGRRG